MMESRARVARRKECEGNDQGEVVAAIVERIRPVAKAIPEWISELDTETLKELAELDED